MAERLEPPEQPAQGEQISDSELRKRVIYSLLTPAVKLARLFGVPLKDLTTWVETAYFYEVRSTGATLEISGKALGVSQRKATRLSKQLRESFFLPEVGHNLPRRIEFMLWAQPMGSARIKQVLPGVTESAVEAALDVLLSRGRIRERVGRTLMYEAVESVRRLPRDTWMARIGGLNSFVENLTHATFGRFFRREPRAFARTVSFQVPPGAVNELDKLYEELLLPRLREITEQAEECESGEPMQLSLCWAPYEYLKEDKDDDQRGEA